MRLHHQPSRMLHLENSFLWGQRTAPWSFVEQETFATDHPSPPFGKLIAHQPSVISLTPPLLVQSSLTLALLQVAPLISGINTQMMASLALAIVDALCNLAVLDEGSCQILEAQAVEALVRVLAVCNSLGNAGVAGLRQKVSMRAETLKGLLSVVKCTQGRVDRWV